MNAPSIWILRDPFENIEHCTIQVDHFEIVGWRGFNVVCDSNGILGLITPRQKGRDHLQIVQPRKGEITPSNDAVTSWLTSFSWRALCKFNK